MSELRIIWAIARKDIGVWRRQPVTIAATILPPLLFLLVIFFSAAAVGRNPVAVVQQGNGPHAQELNRILENSEAFIVHQDTPDQASAALANLDVAAVITIPTNFDAAYDAHQPDPVIIRINNLNLDFTNDLRRSLPAAITVFYAAQPNSPIAISVAETDLRQRDIDLAQFEMVPILVLLLTIAGLVNSGQAAAREWESQTIKELLLAPISRRSIIAGKLLAGWLTTLLIGGVVLAAGAAIGYLRPDGIYWLTTLLMVVLIAMASTGLGIALGAALRRFQPVVAISVNLAFYLFFLSGGISVAAFLPDWVQTIAHFVPTFYGVHALQMAIFYSSSDQLGTDTLVLAGSALAALVLGTLSMQRNIAN